jgi:DNA polymerase-3 subunit epsilon
VLAEAVQTTLEEGIPLGEVTFCVVDLETTGGSPADSRITEIGAVKYRGGERLGAFETLVNPGVPIPRFITHLTGIDDLAVVGAPPIEWVLPSFAEFAHGCVFVAHNSRFDFTFLNVALSRLDYDPIPPPPVCTARLARRVVWPDVPNVRLRTLSQYFRTAVTPNHRAFDDAQACAEVLHGLLDLGGRLGILTLGDLHQAVRARGRPNFGKIRLAEHLPRTAGVYLFKGRDGHVLYVGKSKDLRGRVKSYFYGDSRKKVEDLLAETVTVEGVPCGSELEALVLETRLIRRHEPKYNRRGKTWRKYAYLKVDTAEAFPRIKVVREPSGVGVDVVVLGPFLSSQHARLAKEALEDAVPIRRCTTAMRASTRFAPCALAEMGRCLAPCDGRADPERYGESVRFIVSSLSRPGGLLAALEGRMEDLAARERFEEASLARDRLRALAEGLARTRTDGWLLAAGELVVRDAGGARTSLRGGSLDGEEPLPLPCPRERADELAAVRSWLGRNRVRIEHAEHPPAEPVDGGGELFRLLARLREAGRDNRSAQGRSTQGRSSLNARRRPT